MSVRRVLLTVVKLIRHCFALLTINHYISLTGIETVGIDRQGYDLYPIEEFVGSIVADNNRRSFLLNLSTC